MTEWVLVLMVCSRNCMPQYAVVFPTQTACHAQIDGKTSVWETARKFCIPLIKGEVK